MARAKVHKRKVRQAHSEEQVEFSGEPLVHVNIQTGEGYCRIKELWERQGAERFPSDNKEVC